MSNNAVALTDRAASVMAVLVASFEDLEGKVGIRSQKRDKEGRGRTRYVSSYQVEAADWNRTLAIYTSLSVSVSVSE